MQSIILQILLFLLFIKFNCGTNISDDNSILKFYFISEICEQNGNINIPDFSFIQHLEVIQNTRIIVNKGSNFTGICGYFNSIPDTNEIFWQTPQELETDRNIRILESNYLKFLYNFIQIINANPETDSGIYECILNNQSIQIHIVVTDVSETKYETITHNIIVEENELIVLQNVWYPWKIAKWYRPNKTLIIPSKENQTFMINTNFVETRLVILKAETKLIGNYTLETCQGKLYYIYEVLIKHKPKLIMDDLLYVKIGNFIEINCNSTGFPMVEFSWIFTPCEINLISKCLPNETINFNNNEKNLYNFEITNNNLNKINQISTLKYKPIQDGIITCWARNEIGDYMINRQLTVGDLTNKPFQIIENDKENIMKTNSTIDISIICAATKSLFYENVTWLKNNQKLLNSSDYSIINDDRSKYSYRKILKFQHLTFSNNGTYECRAFTRHNGKMQNIFFNVILEVSSLFWFYFGASAVIAFLSTIIFGLLIHFFNVSKKKIKLRKLDLQNFENGFMANFNSDLMICEQADLLPFVKRFEFPKSKLKIGERLGNGVFGVVYQAEARNILPDYKQTIVAVKTLTTDANKETLKALISELKILQYLGKHLNVVNLLGCITKNLYKRELMLILEYCNYGNIENYLQKNRNNFFNQIDNRTDLIIDSLKLNKPIDCCQNDQPSVKLRTLNDNVEEELQPLNINEISPLLTTTDLVSWAFQIACGMDYLQSRKIVHGDLAARNILLCYDNIVKICDFGFAKTMKDNGIYKKNINSRLPLKWLALESLSNHKFTIYSDIWSFGITLWEIFSLGENPYENLNETSEFVKKIEAGYRMEKPKFANETLFKIMTDCWNATPKYRPVFHKLKQRFADILNYDLVEHYVNLNEKFMVNNVQYFNTLDKDVLSQIDVHSNDVPAETEYENVNNLNIENLRLAIDSVELMQLEELCEPKYMLRNLVNEETVM